MTDTPPQSDSRALWYCVQTKPKQEAKVAALLQREQAVDEVISLSVRFKRMRMGAPIWVREALFSGYLFARFDFLHNHRRIRAASGVAGIVHFGDQPAEISSEIVAELRGLCEAGEIITINPTIEPGAEVAVTSGPLRGLRALVSRVLPARERVAILLEMLGMHREVEIERNRVIATRPRQARRER